jgi:hypothetical protein
MRHNLAVILLIAAAALPSAASAAPPKVTGSWEAARTPDDERLYVVLRDMGKAEIVAEYDFTLPGQPGRRRGRSTTFGKWTLAGNEVVVTYAKLTDRLRYVESEPLSPVGLSGSAPALKPVGKIDPKSKIGSAVLWKAPHEYRVKTAEHSQPAAAATAPAPAAPGADSAK